VEEDILAQLEREYGQVVYEPSPQVIYRPNPQEEAARAAQAAAQIHAMREQNARANAVGFPRAPELDRKELAPQGLESIPGYERIQAPEAPVSTARLEEIDADIAQTMAQFPDQTFLPDEIKKRNADRTKHEKELSDNKRKTHELDIRGKHLARLFRADTNITSLRKERVLIREIKAPREVEEEKRLNREARKHAQNEAWVKAQAEQMREQEAMWRAQYARAKKARTTEDKNDEDEEGKHDDE